MNNLVVFGGAGADHLPTGEHITIDGVSLGCGLLAAAPRVLDRSRPGFAHAVVVRTTALSCNYRDRTLLRQMRYIPASRYSPIGSEFVGEVVAVGPEVASLRSGDRVIPDHHYTGGTVHADGVREGIVTNQASRRMQILPEQKLLAIPAVMSNEIAAAFSLGAQTAYSMVRRLEVVPGAPVLVMAGGSNTSLFVIAALRRAGAIVYATTSSTERVPQLHSLGVDHVFVRARGAAPGADDNPLHGIARENGGFAAVADPFFDLNVAEAIDLLRPFGRYVTCGLAAQNTHLLETAAPRSIDANSIFLPAIQKNLVLMGNCIGLRSDLRRALHDYEAGTLTPVIDSVFDGGRVSEFFNRTYNHPGRFGKVVYRYDD